MVQSHGFKSITHPHAVCQLMKPLYDLKQASWAWLSKITQYLHRIGYRMSKSNNSLLIWRESIRQLFIIIYVDDLLIGGEHIANINNITVFLYNKFEMKDIKELHYFLGIEVIWNPDGIMISRRLCIKMSICMELH